MPNAPPLQTLAVIALGGAAGAIARYGLALWGAWAVPNFPAIGTLAANLAGCCLIGLLMALAQRGTISETARQLLVTGFLGALTTFSTFSWQTIELARERHWGAAVVNVALNCGLGLPAVLLGLWLARRYGGG